MSGFQQGFGQPFQGVRISRFPCALQLAVKAQFLTKALANALVTMVSQLVSLLASHKGCGPESLLWKLHRRSLKRSPGNTVSGKLHRRSAKHSPGNSVCAMRPCLCRCGKEDDGTQAASGARAVSRQEDDSMRAASGARTVSGQEDDGMRAASGPRAVCRQRSRTKTPESHFGDHWWRMCRTSVPHGTRGEGR